MNQIVQEPEPKNSDAWSRSPKFEFRLDGPGPDAAQFKSSPLLRCEPLVSLLLC